MQVLQRVECLSPDFLKKFLNKTKTHFRWDPNYAACNIEVSGDRRYIFLKEDTYQFRSIVADTGFERGLHYWELVADYKTDNELKVGVTKNREFDVQATAFSDY